MPAAIASGYSHRTARPPSSPAIARRHDRTSPPRRVLAGARARSRSRQTSTNAAKPSSALRTCEKYSVENGSTSVPVPSVMAVAMPLPGAIRSAPRATSRSSATAGTSTPSRPSAPRQRRVVDDRDAGLDRARLAVAVLPDRQRARGPWRAAAGLPADACLTRRRIGARRIEGAVQRERREHEAGRLDGVVVTFGVGDIVRLPLPAVDLRGAPRERLGERHVRRLSPARRLHDKRAGEGEDRQRERQPMSPAGRWVRLQRPLEAHRCKKAKR